MCQVPCQRLIYRAAPPWAEAQCCCSGPWGKTIPSKKEKTIESYIMENMPGVFWVYSSEETNLQEHKAMDGKTLLNGGSHG